MKLKIYYGLLFFVTLLCISSCKTEQRKSLFIQLSSEQSGINFRNDIQDNDSSVSFINEFGYMGGGVGIGDFNNDGLKDIFFTGNQVSCRLYVNEGANHFKDITGTSGLLTESWCTGVSIADINNDGFDDIYVCVLGKNLQEKSANLLFINQRNLTFKEAAKEYGLADPGYSTQAAFLDYDRDGDLDMYLTNYLLSANNTNAIYPRDRSGLSPANDKLFRNDGDSSQSGHPVFKDISMSAGIKEDGYGLGVSISDFNNDGWPDIYVANDFVSNDLLWLNNHDGTFTNCIDKAIRHQSYSSMGVDAADLNNDAMPDLVTLDMLPESNARKKTSVSIMNYERYQAERAMGYEPEFVRNMLQLNNGNRKIGDTTVPYFSEIGQLSGIDATDWSWSVLLADFDNDGWKDMHITNGMGRDFIHGDFLEFSNQVFSSSMTREEKEKAIRKNLAAQKSVELPNYLYLNNHDLTFADKSQEGGTGKRSISNGAAYTDMDNDGDLDLVVNNINSEAFIFVNNTNDPEGETSTHYLGVQLKNSNNLNRKGFGSKVFLYSNGLTQMQEQNPVRGYFSSVDQELLFGLGSNAHIDSLLVVWPDEKKQMIRNIRADTVLTLLSENATVESVSTPVKTQFLFSDITASSGIAYRHVENVYNDFAVQRLLPQKYSQLGPFIATGDINKDGATDFFVGGGFNFSGQVFTQNPGNLFSSKMLIDGIKLHEDMDCLLFDADKDGDDDLLVTCGEVPYKRNSIYYKPRLYVNDGKGEFKLNQNAIPDAVKTIAGSVCAGDYDGDGDTDLFIGGRVSGVYPKPARSYILENSEGIFKDVTSDICPVLQLAGMVTGSVWADYDGDKQTDLIIAGEWMPVRFFKNDHGKLTETTKTNGLNQMNGMWRSLIQCDMDNDGDIDFVAGNLGLNNSYRVSETEPMEVFGADIDKNGLFDPVLFYFIKDADGRKHSYPAISRGLLSEQVPSIKKKFLRYQDYSYASYSEIFNSKSKVPILKLFCDETRSCYFENLGNGKFVKHPLPVEAQFAPVNAIICDDFDNDGLKDLLLAGNEYQTEVITGRYDASYGCFLRGTSAKSFSSVPSFKSGFVLNGDVKDMSMISLPGGRKLLLVAINNDSLRVFSVNNEKHSSRD